jgi:hypothetical protein
MANVWYLADGSMTCDKEGSVIEDFTQLRQDPRPPHKYSFAYTLTFYDMEKHKHIVINRGVLTDFRSDGKTEIKRINITERAMRAIPLRLLLTDMSDYGAGQPLLALYIIVYPLGGGPSIRMPAVFKTGAETLEVKNRQIDMPMPPMESLTLEFDLRAMEQGPR